MIDTEGRRNHMQVDIPLDKMTVEDKLRAIEEIWSDLLRAPDALPAPAWHADVLNARADRIRENKSRFNDWSDAKVRIRERT
jgi:hypothetical protein